jgi:hypothetical protein
VPSGPTSRMEKDPQAQVTRKLSGSIGRMEKGPTGTRRMEKRSSGNFYHELKASVMSNCRSHRYTSDGEGYYRMEKRMSNYRTHRYMSDGEGSHRMEKGPSGDFYDELDE